MRNVDSAPVHPFVEGWRSSGCSAIAWDDQETKCATPEIRSAPELSGRISLRREAQIDRGPDATARNMETRHRSEFVSRVRIHADVLAVNSAVETARKGDVSPPVDV